MKKLILLTLCLLSQLASLQAIEIQGRVAYFYPLDDRMRKVYDKSGWAEYEIEVAAPLNLCCDCSRDWDVFFNTSYYFKKGKSTCLHNHTDVSNWAFNFGVKRYFDLCSCLRPYAGLGLGFAHVHFHDRSPFVKNKIDKCGFAFLVKSGVRYDINCNLFADVFFDYAFNYFDFRKNRSCVSRNSIDTGGLKVGLGLGYQF
jgi:hypothetical protein